MYNHLNIVSSNFPYIPPKAFLYEPISRNPDIQNQSIQSLQTDDYIIKLKDGNFKRCIFQGNVKYTKFQNTKLQEFQSYLQRKNITIDQRWDRSWRLRWLSSTNYDNKKTVQDMKQFIQYQEKNKQHHLKEKVQKFLKQGIYYLAGRDSKFRPILVLDVKKMVKLKIKQEDVADVEAYFFQFLVRHMLIPGKVQQWNSVLDVGNEGVLSMAGPMKQSISFLQSTFRSRMYVAYVVRPSSTCSFLWSIAQGFLQQDTKRKVQFVEGDVMTSLLAYCNPQQLEKKFGGVVQNFTNDCFPPRILSDDYSSNQKTTILTIQQYRQKYKNNELQNTKVYQPFLIEPHQLKIQQKVEIEIQQKMIQGKYRKIMKKSVTFNIIEVNSRITQSLQKLKQQDLSFLSHLNAQSKRLCAQNDLDWLIL